MATNYWCCGTVFAIFLLLVHLNLVAATKQNEDFFQFENNSLDISILKSKNEKFLTYRNTGKKECYIERVTIRNSEDEQNSRTLYVGQEPLKKSDKVYAELDDDTKNFCDQFSLFVLQDEPPTYISKNKHIRKRRGAQMPKPRYRSQTQSQYISFDGGRGNNTSATQLAGDSGNSRLVVSGNIRLEQSQSQFASTDCSECNGWPQGPQSYEIPTNPPLPGVNRLPTGQSYPSNQQQTGSQPQNFIPGNGVSPSGIPGQQIIPSGPGYFPGGLPTSQSSGNVNPQLPAYFTPGSPHQQVSQSSPYLSPNTQYIPQPGSANTPTNFQIPASSFQPTQQSSFINPAVNPQTGPFLPPNLSPTNQGVGGSSYPLGPQYLVPGSQQQNSGASSGSQSAQYFPRNPQPVEYYNTRNVNNFSHTPANFYLVLQPSQQHPQVSQYYLINSQTIHPQNSHSVPSYFTATMPLQGSHPQAAGYIPPSKN